MINDSDFQVGKVIQFLCGGRGRGGHYGVAATITKVNHKSVKAIECNRSYKPGTRWVVSKSEVYKVRDPMPPHPCVYCKGAGITYNWKCEMCNGTGTIPHETYNNLQETA